jgi:hypothetical protein
MKFLIHKFDTLSIINVWTLARNRSWILAHSQATFLGRKSSDSHCPRGQRLGDSENARRDIVQCFVGL